MGAKKWVSVVWKEIKKELCMFLNKKNLNSEKSTDEHFKG